MVLGYLATIPFANLIATQLYGVSTHDPLTYAIVLAALSAAALFASYLAARRAMHLDPMVALRPVIIFASWSACFWTSFEYPWHFAVSHLTPNLLCICVS
jgi:hypothetical protein